MNIASLDPACTEWVAAFGAIEELVGRSHACDFPDEVQCRPALTEPLLAQPSIHIQRGVEGLQPLTNAGSRSLLHSDRLASLKPDIILSSPRSGISRDDIDRALRNWTATPPARFTADASTFKDVLDTALRLGNAIGHFQDAMALIGEKEKYVRDRWIRLGQKERGGTTSRMPTVICIENLDPLTIAGRWVPDMVKLAGGRPLLAAHSEGRRPIDWSVVANADADVLAIMVSETHSHSIRMKLDELIDHAVLKRLKAVVDGRVVAVADAYFDRPGPRLYRGIDLLASALYPDKIRLDAGAEEMLAIRR